MRDTEGLTETVSDDEIIEKQLLLAKKEAIFAEPTGAVSLAGAIKLAWDGTIDRSDVVVCVITGHGLNDIEHTITRFPEVPQIQPFLDEFEKTLSNRKAGSLLGE